MEDSEECSSSESGWTMYLASPMHEDDEEEEEDGEVEDGGGGEDDNRGRSNKDDDDGNDDDDDSMASDASSGPAASCIGHGKGSKVVERKNNRVEAKEEEISKTKSSKMNPDKDGGATSKVRGTKANK